MPLELPSHPIDIDDLFALHQKAAKTDPEHRYFTGLHVGHEPTEQECFQYWISSGAMCRFEEMLRQRGLLI